MQLALDILFAGEVNAPGAVDGADAGRTLAYVAAQAAKCELVGAQDVGHIGFADTDRAWAVFSDLRAIESGGDFANACALWQQDFEAQDMLDDPNGFGMRASRAMGGLAARPALDNGLCLLQRKRLLVNENATPQSDHCFADAVDQLSNEGVQSDEC